MRVWLEDRWTKAAIIDGHKVQPPAAQLRKLSTLDDRFKTDRFSKGKRWRVSWYEQDPKTSKKRLKHLSRDTKQAAEELRASLEDDIRAGRYIDPSAARKTFSEAATAWLAAKQKQKPATLSRYQRELNTYVLPRWGTTTLESITEDAINEWVTKLTAGKAPAEYKREQHKQKPLSPASIRHIVKITFGGILAYTVRRRWLAFSPLDNVETPRIPEQDKVFLTYQEVETLADTAKLLDGETSATLIRFLAYTGPRINEALSLKVEDIDIEAGRISISRTWSSDGKGGRIEGPTKTHEKRKTAIPTSLIPDLKKLITGQPLTAYLFRAPRGGAISDTNWRNRTWYKAVEGAGLEIPGLTIHSLRHTFASLAIAAGADVKTLQSMMGHASATITLDTYASLWPERLGEVADAIDAKRANAMQSSPNTPQTPKTEILENKEKPPTGQ